MNSQRLLAATAILLMTAGCSGSKDEKTPADQKPAKPAAKLPTPAAKPPTPVPKPAVKESQLAFEGQAKALISEFQGQLQKTLMAAMKDGGPPTAIKACSEQATAIADKAARDGLRIRRIGTRIRNPGNQPSEADQQVLAALTKYEATKTLMEPARYYQAIFVMPVCLGCHGPADKLAKETRAALATHYPDDKATGYQVGDLRGAFVVEKSAEKNVEKNVEKKAP